MENILLKEDRIFYDVGFTTDLEPFLANDFSPNDLKYIDGFDTIEEAKACIRGILSSNKEVEYVCILKTYVSYTGDDLSTNDCSVVYEVYDKDILEDYGKEKILN